MQFFKADTVPGPAVGSGIPSLRLPLLRLRPVKRQIGIIVGQIQGIHDIQLIGTVKHGGGHVEAQGSGSQGQMNLQYLSNVHTGRHAQRIQHDIQRTSVGQVRHIFHRQNPGNHTLVTVTACHLVAHGNLSLLCNIDTDRHIHAGGQLITVLPGKHLGVHHNAVLAVRHFQGRIPHLSGLLAEDGPQQPLLCGKLGLSLGRHLAHQNIACAHFRADSDNSPVVQILQSIIAHAGHIPGDLLGPQLGIPGFCLVFFNMDGGIHIFHHQSLAEQNGILVVVTFPGHKADQRVLAQCQFAFIGGRTVGDHLSRLHMIPFKHNGFLIVAVGLVAAGELGKAELRLLAVIKSHFNQVG